MASAAGDWHLGSGRSKGQAVDNLGHLPAIKRLGLLNLLLRLMQSGGKHSMHYLKKATSKFKIF